MNQSCNRRSRFASTIICVWVYGFLLSVGSSGNAAPPYASKVGVDLDGVGDGAREKPFVDVAKTLRPWTPAPGTPTNQGIPLDEHGWPKSDAATVLFDTRPVFAWAPPMDDPDAFTPDWGGVYSVSFEGRAEVSILEDKRCKVDGMVYDNITNNTKGRIIVPKGVGLLVVAFTKSHRNPTAAEGTGISKLRVIRPGYPAETKQTFTNEFLASVKPFAVLRFMDWLDSNHQPGYFGDPGRHALKWPNRRKPDDATQVSFGEQYGVAWELIVELANLTKKDIWINIPVAATDEYVMELARKLKGELDPRLNIYIEHSNEVWNFGFPQYIYNKLAAVEEVEKGGSKLASDGSKDQEVWARRRHAERLIQIGQIFRKVFGEKGSQGRIRPIYASWLIFPEPYYQEVLDWVKKTRGEPSEHFYGLASAAYFNIDKAPKDATVDQLLDAMRISSDENAKLREQLAQDCRAFWTEGLPV